MLYCLLLLEVPVFEISVLKCEPFLFSLAPFLKIKVDICSLKLGKRGREGGREKDGENERGRGEKESGGREIGKEGGGEGKQHGDTHEQLRYY